MLDSNRLFICEMCTVCLTLTCLHCRSFARLGKWDINSPTVIDVPVAKYIPHNQYDVALGQHDIGLVKLQTNIVYTGTQCTWISQVLTGSDWKRRNEFFFPILKT